MVEPRAMEDLCGDLIRAKQVGIRALRTHLSFLLERHEVILITKHKKPVYALVPWDRMKAVVNDVL